jgi:catechol 2,3-dioxygenase-like lactoylglutathione lyase family enzyme
MRPADKELTQAVRALRDPRWGRWGVPGPVAKRGDAIAELPLTPRAQSATGRHPPRPHHLWELRRGRLFRPSRGGIVLTHFLVTDDVDRSRAFYTEVLGGEALMDGEPTIVALANSWIIINTGGGPTDDKPSITLEAPHDLDRVSAFLNIRVADIAAVYADWSAKGAQFLTEPIDRGPEIRCYLRDPDGCWPPLSVQTTALLKMLTTAGGPWPTPTRRSSRWRRRRTRSTRPARQHADPHAQRRQLGSMSSS